MRLSAKQWWEYQVSSHFHLRLNDAISVLSPGITAMMRGSDPDLCCHRRR